jgi:hypothetical protein
MIKTSDFEMAIRNAFVPLCTEVCLFGAEEVLNTNIDTTVRNFIDVVCRQLQITGYKEDN